MDYWKIQSEEYSFSIELPKSYSDFLHLVKHKFQLIEFVAIHCEKIVTEQYYYKIHQSLFRIIDIKKMYKYYDAFIAGQSIPCCNNTNCTVCLGQQYAIIKKDDQEIIDSLVRNRLQIKLQEIQRKINVNNIPQFLEYCQHKYSVKLINQSQNNIIVDPNQQLCFKITYQNNGTIDWPYPLYMKCVENAKLENIKQKVDSLKVGITYEQAIEFRIPYLESGNHYTFWRLVYYRNENEYQFGPKIAFSFAYQNDKQQQEAADYYLQNRKCLDKVQSLDKELLSLLNMEKAEEILEKNRTRKLTQDDIFNLLSY